MRCLVSGRVSTGHEMFGVRPSVNWTEMFGVRPSVNWT